MHIRNIILAVQWRKKKKYKENMKNEKGDVITDPIKIAKTIER